jgi:putative ABC transport system substrate-binding protein
MKRRTFVALAAMGLSSAGRALGRSPRRIGILSTFSLTTSQRWHDAFVEGLRDLGWIDGETIRIHSRYASGRTEALPGLAEELIDLGVEVVAAQTEGDARAIQALKPTIPIVMASSPDLVRLGLAQSLPRPAGPITGLSEIASEITAKRLQILREIVPQLTHLAVLIEPTGANSRFGWEDLQVPARSVGVAMTSVASQDIGQFNAAFLSAIGAGAQAILVMPNPLFAENLGALADLAMRYRLASMFHLREFAMLGGLVTYGADRRANFRLAARYVDRILNGAQPADLPIEQPTKVELVINMRTAAALGLRVPTSVLARADEVIE